MKRTCLVITISSKLSRACKVEGICHVASPTTHKRTEEKTQYSFSSLKSWHPTLYHKTQIYSNKPTMA
jgi:hypothetical protein